jgi:excisionase family DNA binding protein
MSETVKLVAPNALRTPQEAAEYLRTTPSTLSVWRSTNRQRLAFVKIGGLVRYRQSDLDKFIADRLVDNAE